MTKSGKFLVTGGLLLYGTVSLLAIIIALTNKHAMRGVPLVVVSAPWSLGIVWILSALSSNPFDGPWADFWAIGVGLTGIMLNSVLFCLFIMWIVGWGPQVEPDAETDRSGE